MPLSKLTHFATPRSGHPSPSTSAASRPFWIEASALCHVTSVSSVPPWLRHMYMGRYGSGLTARLVVKTSRSPSRSTSSSSPLVGHPLVGGVPNHAAVVAGPPAEPK